MFPELHFLPPLEISHIHDIKEHMDIIFPTSYVSLGANIHAPVIRGKSGHVHRRALSGNARGLHADGKSFLKQPNVDVVMGSRIAGMRISRMSMHCTMS